MTRRPPTTLTPAVETRSRVPQFAHDIILNADAALPDRLKRDHLAHVIAEEIHTVGPQVIGIYGSWGAGKSYLLSLIINALFKQNQHSHHKVMVCAFQPWRYEIEGDLALGLIKSLREIPKQFEGRNPQFTNHAYIRRRADALLGFIASVLISSGQAGFALAGGALKTAMQRLEHGDDVLRIEHEMQALVSEIVTGIPRQKADEWRLVVFIDDLDRCSPDKMVSMFEWLKVHLNDPRVTYVLALDHVAAARAIVGTYKKYLGDEEDISYGFRYLEKLVESEYELEEASLVEAMAIAEYYDKRYGKQTHFHSVSEIARDLYGGDFPGIQNIEDLINLRSLRVPRTMLKIVNKFEQALRIIRESGTDIQGRLPASYPFWTLLLICMYFRLDPESLADFMDGRSDLYDLLAPNGRAEIGDEDWRAGPKREFWQFAERLKQYAGAGLHVPNTEILQQLAAIIRENVLARSQYMTLHSSFPSR